MALYRPGSEVPYRSRPENQPVTISRKTWRELMRRIESLEQAVEVLHETNI